MEDLRLKKSEIEAETEVLLKPVLDSGGYDLWDIEYTKEGADYYLRIYVDKEGGIDIDDCVSISHQLEKKLDDMDFIQEAYTLEVSSPGLTRPLRRDREFEKSIGRLVHVKLFQPIDGCKEFDGNLKAYDEKQIVIVMNDEELIFERKNISLVRLEFID